MINSEMQVDVFETTVTGKQGIRLVRQVIEELWKSVWHDVVQSNDIGTDGIVQICKSQRQTGGLIFVQVKCGKGYRREFKKRPKFIGVNLGKGHIETHKPRWEALPGPAVLVFVDPDSGDPKFPDAWWVDLKSTETYTKENSNVILIPTAQRFGVHSKGHLLRLCDRKALDTRLPTVSVSHRDYRWLSLAKPYRKNARDFFTSEKTIEAASKDLGNVNFNRVGWRHLNRRGRKSERILQSLSLLPAAKKIISTVETYELLGRAESNVTNGKTTILDYLGLRARVVFPHREAATVRVILRRKRVVANNVLQEKKLWFYSVFEPNRD